LRAQPDHLIIDVSVAGVSGGRTSDEKVPRAWVVLSEEGKRRGEAKTIAALIAWTQGNLTKYKWLRGGIEVVDEVSCVLLLPTPSNSFGRVQIPKTATGKVLRRVLQDKYEAEHSEVKGKL
jgi:acyl-CoA synthetase (AMP-forming)/AMP-acid ligase II